MIQLRKTNIGKSVLRVWPAVTLAACGVMIGAVGAMADVSAAPTAEQAVMMRPTGMRDGFVRTADLFGESDKEKAERLAHEQGQDAAIAQANQKIDDLEDTVRRMQGQMEMLHHQLDEANAHIDRMQKDFDYKICTMTAQQLGTDAANLPCNGAGPGAPPQSFNAPPSSPPPSNDPNAPRQLGTPPGILGQIPSNTPMPIPPPAGVSDGSAPPQPASSPNRPQFDAAMNQLSKGQYDEASAGFRAFADANPQDSLTPNAVYWVGAIAYVRKDYQGAARAFVEEIKKYGTAPRAPDSMLKLGQSLIAMGQKPQGCTTLDALPGKYPQASPNILGQAKAARKTAGCK